MSVCSTHGDGNDSQVNSFVVELVGLSCKIAALEKDKSGHSVLDGR